MKQCCKNINMKQCCKYKYELKIDIKIINILVVFCISFVSRIL